jgi:hypothetical protein
MFVFCSLLWAQKNNVPQKKEVSKKQVQQPEKNQTIDLDKIFSEQESPSKTNTSIDSAVFSSAEESGRKVFDRTEEIRNEERRKIESYSRQETGGATYACSVTCTGSWWASGANINVTLMANGEEKAKEIAATQADPLCRKQTNTSGVFKKTFLTAGSAKCEKK